MKMKGKSIENEKKLKAKWKEIEANCMKSIENANQIN